MGGSDMGEGVLHAKPESNMYHFHLHTYDQNLIIWPQTM